MFFQRCRATTCPEDWRQGLKDPIKHWRPGYSAWALAHCWEAAHGFPPEIRKLLQPIFPDIQMECGLVEHLVGLPGRGGASHNDLFVLASVCGEGICIAVEGKVREKFGPALKQWRNGSQNREARLAGLLDLLGLPRDVPETLRYQLLHRLASALREAQIRRARHAIMIIHSFSELDESFQDFAALLELYTITYAQSGELYHVHTLGNIELYAGWAHGDARFASPDLPGED